ncbi:hypothetical protein KY289_008966 [Solanum tuberosum]|nr:hypothetical protein KY289_008966 [Solanum tuberosum]
MVLSQIEFRVMHMFTIELKALIEFKGVQYTRLAANGTYSSDGTQRYMIKKLFK